MRKMNLEFVVVAALGVSLLALIVSAVVLAALRVPIPSEISGSIPVVIGGFVGVMRFAQPSGDSSDSKDHRKAVGIKVDES